MIWSLYILEWWLAWCTYLGDGGIVLHGKCFRPSQEGSLVSPVKQGPHLLKQNRPTSHNDIQNSWAMAGCYVNNMVDVNGNCKYQQVLKKICQLINSCSATYTHMCKACSATVSARDSSIAVLNKSVQLDWNWPTVFIMDLLQLFIGAPSDTLQRYCNVISENCNVFFNLK